MGNFDNISAIGARFEFAGKERNMVFVNKAVRYLKEKHGGFQKAIKMIDDENGEMNIDILADIMYAGFMVNKDESLTREKIVDALDEMPYFEARKIATTHLVAAITGTYPAAKSSAEGSADPQ
jgi:hypothetical protein